MTRPLGHGGDPVASRDLRSLLAGAGRAAFRSYGSATARWRPDPDFLVIGAKRGGSTSFYYDLLTHSHITPLFPRPDHLPKARSTKGIHFFDSNFERGERWYRSHLPSSAVRNRVAGRVGSPVLVGEASPYYLFHPAAAQRAHDMVPTAKIIAVLRDPVMRTHSHWKERRRAGVEQLEFRQALDAEDERIGQVEDRLTAEAGFHSYAHENFSYARQSEYAPALARWYAQFPAEQILILASEDYYADPQSQLGRVARFLGLPSEPLASGRIRNAAEGSELDTELSGRLAARFAPFNAQLSKLTGRSFPWSGEAARPA